MAKQRGIKRKLRVCRIKVSRASRRIHEAATVTLNLVGSVEEFISISCVVPGEPSG
jgi:hypothetical protein